MAGGGAAGGRLGAWFRAAPLASRLGTLGLILAALSLVVPWYGVSIMSGGSANPAVEYSLTQEARHDPDGRVTSYPVEAAGCRCPAVGRLMGLVQLLTWTGAALAAGAYWAREGRPRPPRAAGIALTSIAGLLLVAGPVLLALSAPAAFQSDGEYVARFLPTGRWGSSFMGSLVESPAETSAWGPTLGWFLALFGAALTLSAVTAGRKAVPAELRPTAPRVAPPHAAPTPAEAASRENAFVPPSG